MNWYHIFCDGENCRPDAFVPGDEDLLGFSWQDLSIGKFIEGWSDRAILRSAGPHGDGEPEDVVSTLRGAPIVSRSLRESLAASHIAASDIQYLPIRLVRSSGDEVPGFAVANVLDRLPALDRARSVFLKVDPSEIDPATGLPAIMDIGIPALKLNVIEARDIIRIPDLIYPVFVSQRFVDLFKRERCTGVSFERVNVV